MGATVRREPITDASAWSAEEMAADRRWIRELTASESADLLRALSDSDETTPDGTPKFVMTPAMTEFAEEVLEELENGRGFVLVRGMPLEGLDEDALRRLYRVFGAYLGTAITQDNRGRRIVEITDKGVPYGPGVRGGKTRAFLHPHNDATDVVALFCIRPARERGESCIASAMTMFNTALTEHPEYIDLLFDGYHHNMRGEGVSGDPNEVTDNAIPIYSQFAGRLSCHFNRRLIVQGAEKSGRTLGATVLAALDYVNDLALRDGIRLDMEFQRGDVQLLNNHMIMHSRRDYEDYDDPALKRRLLRLWLNVPNGRPLAPDFADRTNGGPRGGMRVLPEYR